MNAARKSIATTDHPALKNTSIAVVGGGIGGLTAALAFAKRGADVVVFEQAAKLGDVGAGLQITPNGARALSALGITPDGIIAQAVLPTDGLSGKTITRFDLSQKSPPYRFVHRATLIDQMAQGCQEAGVTFQFDSHVTTKPKDFDLCVGADGIKSALRPILNGPQDPFFTGQVAWRAIIEHDAPPLATIWMQPGAHVVTYPLTQNRLNIVAVQERSTWANEGWMHADDPANLRAAFSNSAPELQALLGKVTTTHLWGLFRHSIAEHWHQDDLVLLGDAAHPTLPFLAQGANLAIEDAYTLARCCADHGLTAGPKTYESARKPRVTKAIAAANANAKNYHLRGAQRAFSFAALQGIGKIAPNAFINRLAWLYDHDVTA